MSFVGSRGSGNRNAERQPDRYLRTGSASNDRYGRYDTAHRTTDTGYQIWGWNFHHKAVGSARKTGTWITSFFGFGEPEISYVPVFRTRLQRGNRITGYFKLLFNTLIFSFSFT